MTVLQRNDGLRHQLYCVPAHSFTADDDVLVPTEVAPSLIICGRMDRQNSTTIKIGCKEANADECDRKFECFSRWLLYGTKPHESSTYGRGWRSLTRLVRSRCCGQKPTDGRRCFAA